MHQSRECVNDTLFFVHVEGRPCLYTYLHLSVQLWTECWPCLPRVTDVLQAFASQGSGIMESRQGTHRGSTSWSGLWLKRWEHDSSWGTAVMLWAWPRPRGRRRAFLSWGGMDFILLFYQPNQQDSSMYSFQNSCNYQENLLRGRVLEENFSHHHYSLEGQTISSRLQQETTVPLEEPEVVMGLLEDHILSA